MVGGHGGHDDQIDIGCRWRQLDPNTAVQPGFERQVTGRFIGCCFAPLQNAGALHDPVAVATQPEPGRHCRQLCSGT